MLTDNDVLVRKHVDLPTLMCVQRKAEKKIVTEDDLIQANINSMGNSIGAITNRVTSMFEVQSHFDKDSEEYKILDYRIKTGQNFQQNSIDKTKGIIAKPMPGNWYNWHAANQIKDPEKRELYLSILAEKKPRFMIYIYPNLMSEYKKFMKDTNKKCIREFSIAYEDLCKLPEDTRTREQNTFLADCNKKVPVGTGNCVMNIICKKFEDEFDKYLTKSKFDSDDFDYTVMKSGVSYEKRMYNNIRKLCKEFTKRIKEYTAYAAREHINEDEQFDNKIAIEEAFRLACDEVCSDHRVLTDIMLDLCYTEMTTCKRFVWAMCGEDIVENLLAKHNNMIHYPERDENGDIEFRGNKFTLKEKEIDLNEYRS